MVVLIVLLPRLHRRPRGMVVQATHMAAYASNDANEQDVPLLSASAVVVVQPSAPSVHLVAPSCISFFPPPPPPPQPSAESCTPRQLLLRRLLLQTTRHPIASRAHPRRARCGRGHRSLLVWARINVCPAPTLAVDKGMRHTKLPCRPRPSQRLATPTPTTTTRPGPGPRPSSLGCDGAARRRARHEQIGVPTRCAIERRLLRTEIEPN